MVRLEILEPNTFPTDRPPSPDKAAIVETESSGSEVAIERSKNPAAISDSPRVLDIAST